MFGKVSKIQRFSLHDGDGIRTTVFLKGCNLRCVWCHNPETWDFDISIQTYFDNKCIGCGECFKVCPKQAHKIINGKHIIDRNLCIRCGECAKQCYAQAIVANGKDISSDQIIDEVKKDYDLYLKSSGGITLSGGEALLQKEFVKEVLSKAKKMDINTAIDTAGNVDFKNYEDINEYVDMYLYDIKCIDEKIHTEITGVSNKLILENLIKLNDIAKKIYIRMPILKDLNDSEQLIEDTAKFLSKLDKIKCVDILPVHSLAADKYRSLDLDYSRIINASQINKKQIEKYIEIFNSYGINCKEN